MFDRHLLIYTITVYVHVSSICFVSLNPNESPAFSPLFDLEGKRKTKTILHTR